jgi:hypothetical protein
MEKIIVINCYSCEEQEILTIQKHFFDNGCNWYSNISNDDDIKYKKNIPNLLIIENNNMFEGIDSVLKDIEKEIIKFNSPTEFLRYYKIKKLKTKIK